MAIDEQLLRGGFGNFLTGVTVTTTISLDSGPVGFTANSFSSVSLSPGLVLFSKMKGVRHYSDFAESGYFGVNVLSGGQEDLAQRFSSMMLDRFEGLEWRVGEHGVPLLSGVLVWFECRRVNTIDAGDHSIILGEVLSLGGVSLEGGDGEGEGEVGEGALGYYRGNYLRLGKERG